MPTHLWAPQIQVIIPDLIVNADQIDQWYEVTSNSVIGQRKSKKKMLTYVSGLVVEQAIISRTPILRRPPVSVKPSDTLRAESPERLHCF
jgi:hypothetical protein